MSTVLHGLVVILGLALLWMVRRPRHPVLTNVLLGLFTFLVVFLAFGGMR